LLLLCYPPSVRVLVDYRPALRARTGVGEFVHELVTALTAPNGPAPPGSLTLFSASWKDRLDPQAIRELRARAVDRRIPGRLLTWAWNRLQFPAVEWLAGPADVVHSATPLAIPTRAGRTVLTIHDLHFLRHPERMQAEMRRDFPRLVHAHAARADAIVVSSSYTAEDVARTLKVPASRIHLCPPGAPRWAAETAERRRTRQPRHILFVGTLDARKNVGVLLKAYAQLTGRRPDAPPLVIAGAMTPAGAAWQEEARGLHLEGLVQWRGYVDQPTRQGLFADAHMLVLPSLDEGFGLPVLEAMACGVPVVVSSGGSLPEVAADAAKPIHPEDVGGFRDAMDALLHPDVAAVASARGLARAAAFCWEQCAVQVWGAYQAALERPA
jgi:glycosyltransferase involved in cell wall biosynthesis